MMATRSEQQGARLAGRGPQAARGAPPAALPRLTGEVLVVRVPLQADAASERAAAALLDGAEAERAARLQLPDVRRRFVVAHAALRRILARHAGVAPAELSFARRPEGKPELSAPSPARALRFSLAHAGELALVALARGREVGVDLEPLRPLPELPRLARRILSAGEAQDFARRPPAEQPAALLRGWTRKEALLKGVGCGLRLPLAGLHLGLQDLPHDGLSVPDPVGTRSRWRLHDLGLPAGWVASVAVADDGEPAPRITLADEPTA